MLNGLLDLRQSLLTTNHVFVMLGSFSRDPLEKEFGYLRQGSGGAYLLPVQQIVEKLDIKDDKDIEVG